MCFHLNKVLPHELHHFLLTAAPGDECDECVDCFTITVFQVRRLRFRESEALCLTSLSSSMIQQIQWIFHLKVWLFFQLILSLC